MDAGALAGAGDILTGESAADEVNSQRTASFSVIACLAPLGRTPVGLCALTRPPVPIEVSGVGHICGSDDSVCGKSSGSKGSDVVIDGHPRPMLFEDGAAIGIDLAEGDGLHAGPLEAEREAADAGKEVEDAQFHDFPHYDAFALTGQASARTMTFMSLGISPKDFEILAFVLSGGAAKLKTMVDKFGKDDVNRLVEAGYLLRFTDKGKYVSLTKSGKKAVTLGLVQ